jgi:peptidoglycan/LPS O-acetylase OafA/YrhL
LSIEEWFYIAFPGVLMTAAWCFRNNRDGFAVLVALCFIGTITLLRLLFGNLDDWGPGVRRVVAFRVDSIAYGFLLYVFVRQCAGIASDWRAAAFNLPAAAVLFIAATSFAGVPMWRIEAAQSHVAETLFPFAAAGFGISAILLAYSARNVFQSNSRLTECCTFL